LDEPSGLFVLNLRNLEEGENHLELAGSAADLGIKPEEAALVGPVVLRATVFRAGQKVEVQGELKAALDLACDRCLEPVRRPLRVPVRIFAERPETRDRRSKEELREEDPGIVYHDGQSVVLTDELRQELLVEVPWHVVCKEGCLGLCPRCGGNRNLGQCSCGGGDAET
jgi:uncharacterized protein